jgi:hypothetical protein
MTHISNKDVNLLKPATNVAVRILVEKQVQYGILRRGGMERSQKGWESLKTLARICSNLKVERSVFGTKDRDIK